MTGIEDILDLPWERIFPMVGTISLLLFTFGPKLGFIRRFFGEAIQDFVGVTALRQDMLTMHEDDTAARQTMHTENQESFEQLNRKVDTDIRRLDARIDDHESDRGLHEKPKQ